MNHEEYLFEVKCRASWRESAMLNKLFTLVSYTHFQNNTAGYLLPVYRLNGVTSYAVVRARGAHAQSGQGRCS